MQVIVEGPIRGWNKENKFQIAPIPRNTSNLILFHIIIILYANACFTIIQKKMVTYFIFIRDVCSEPYSIYGGLHFDRNSPVNVSLKAFGEVPEYIPGYLLVLTYCDLSKITSKAFELAGFVFLAGHQDYGRDFCLPFVTLAYDIKGEGKGPVIVCHIIADVCNFRCEGTWSQKEKEAHEGKEEGDLKGGVIYPLKYQIIQLIQFHQVCFSFKLLSTVFWSFYVDFIMHKI
jgi:hypothetical protein